MAKDIYGRTAAEISWICGKRLAENGNLERGKREKIAWNPGKYR
jgi:hypothetical protein